MPLLLKPWIQIFFKKVLCNTHAWFKLFHRWIFWLFWVSCYGVVVHWLVLPSKVFKNELYNDPGRFPTFSITAQSTTYLFKPLEFWNICSVGSSSKFSSRNQRPIPKNIMGVFNVFKLFKVAHNFHCFFLNSFMDRTPG